MDLCKDHFEGEHRCSFLVKTSSSPKQPSSSSGDPTKKRKRHSQRVRGEFVARRSSYRVRADKDDESDDEKGNEKYEETIMGTTSCGFSKQTRSSRPQRAAAISANVKNAEILQDGIDYHAKPDLLYGSQVHR